MTSHRVRGTASIVRGLYDAYRDRRRTDAENLLAPDFLFISPYDDRIDRAACFARCWPNADHISALEVERITAESDAPFVTCFCTAREATSFRKPEYLTVKDGKITSANGCFGARCRDAVFVTKPED